MKGQDKEEWSRAPGSASWACDPYMQRALHSEEPHACFNVLCQCDGIRNECIREPGLHKSSATGPWSRPVSREDSATRLSPIPSLPHTYSCWPCHTSTESSGRAMRGNPAGLKVNVRSAPSVSDWIIRTLTTPSTEWECALNSEKSSGILRNQTTEEPVTSFSYLCLLSLFMLKMTT